mmetsp:Transcript_30312/g.93534  ORF Transcript_30312/g.93534 Transcript_30312/m.93534 type:complete len:200 (-) Transcript_30312:384-983(-)
MNECGSSTRRWNDQGPAAGPYAPLASSSGRRAAMRAATASCVVSPSATFCASVRSSSRVWAKRQLTPMWHTLPDATWWRHRLALYRSGRPRSAPPAVAGGGTVARGPPTRICGLAGSAGISGGAFFGAVAAAGPNARLSRGSASDVIRCSAGRPHGLASGAESKGVEENTGGVACGAFQASGGSTGNGQCGWNGGCGIC